MRKRADLLLLLPFAAMLGYLQYRYAGYIKDDTYIALRYARNLAEGHGMVFNYGQRLEGYTDFLWIVMSAPAFWLGVDPVVWVKALACAFGQLGLLVTWEISRHLAGGKVTPYALFGAGVWAVSGTVCLWSMAGMEPTAMAVFCSGGVLFLMRLWERKDDAGRDWLWGGLLLIAGALCRPEGHLFLLVAAGVGLAEVARTQELPSRLLRSTAELFRLVMEPALFWRHLVATLVGVVSAARHGRLPRPWLKMAALMTAVMAPYHLWRYLYFGGLVPNTYLAKSGALDVDAGMKFAGELLVFQANPGVFALCVLALVWGLFVREQRFARGLAFLLVAAFVAYLVKVGRDEMKWFRLYLPVYPLALALATDGLRRLGALLSDAPFTKLRPVLGPALATAVTVAALYPVWTLSMEGNLKHADRHSKYLRWSEDSFQAMGRYVRERSEPGDVVVFQDMGAAPFAAGDLRWVDTIGILDKTVATELKKEGVNPFLRSRKMSEPGGRQALRAMDERLRDYFLAQDPEWIAYIAYVPKNKRRSLKRKWKKTDRDDLAEQEKMLRPYLARGHSHHLHRDDRFNDNFHYVKAWPRLNYGYWVVLFERNGR